jgi:ribosome-binding protein aMBF1 (putative translation factor)
MSANNFSDYTPVVLKKTLTKEELVKRGQAPAQVKMNAGTNKQSSSIQNAHVIASNDVIVKPATTTAELASQISKARVAKGLNQEELAKLCNVTKQVIANYEKPSSNAVIDANILQKIARALGVSLKKPKVKKVDLDAN